MGSSLLTLSIFDDKILLSKIGNLKIDFLVTKCIPILNKLNLVWWLGLRVKPIFGNDQAVQKKFCCISEKPDFD